MKKKRITKQIEYPDAPSGCVTFYNYKEPLQTYEGGFGYYGALVFDDKTDQVQCHLCGGWFQALNSEHLKMKHGINASEYKVLVGLNKNTALISETYRSKLIATGQERFKNLKPGKKLSKSHIEAIREGLKKYAKTKEAENIKGTCPLQLIERLQKLADKLGRTPSTDEVSFYNTVVKVFGDWPTALKRAGLSYRKKGQNIRHRQGIKYDEKSLLILLRDFKKREGREPSPSDIRRGILPSMNTFWRHAGGLKAAMKKAYG